MPIREDILGIGGKTSAKTNIRADFFYSGDMYVPNEETKAPKAEPTVEDWRTVVNRSFMKGLTGDEIRQVFDNRGLELTDEQNAYINKYEGLIGPVFIDCRVIEQGFPMTEIPRKFEPYRRFAINCDDVVKKTTKSIEGGFAGELESFLDAVTKLNEKTVDVCRATGLPILKKGMFNDEIIDGLLKMLGAPEKHGQKALQEELKKQLLGIRPAEEKQIAETDNEGKNVLKYRLREAGMTLVPIKEQTPDGVDVVFPGAEVAIPEIQKTREELRPDMRSLALKVEMVPETEGYFSTEAKDFQLEEPTLSVTPEKKQEDELELKFYRPSKKKDISFVTPKEEKKDVRLDGTLRW